MRYFFVVAFMGTLILFGATDVFAQQQFPQVQVNTAQSVVTILNRILQWALSIVGIIAVMVILYAGALFMFSGDNQARRDKAKGYLLWGSIGVAVAIIAGSIVTLIYNILQGQ